MLSARRRGTCRGEGVYGSVYFFYFFANAIFLDQNRKSIVLELFLAS